MNICVFKIGNSHLSMIFHISLMQLFNFFLCEFPYFFDGYEKPYPSKRENGLVGIGTFSVKN